MTTALDMQLYYNFNFYQFTASSLPPVLLPPYRVSPIAAAAASPWVAGPCIVADPPPASAAAAGPSPCVASEAEDLLWEDPGLGSPPWLPSAPASNCTALLAPAPATPSLLAYICTCRSSATFQWLVMQPQLTGRALHYYKQRAKNNPKNHCLILQVMCL